MNNVSERILTLDEIESVSGGMLSLAAALGNQGNRLTKGQEQAYNDKAKNSVLSRYDRKRQLANDSARPKRQTSEGKGRIA